VVVDCTASPVVVRRAPVHVGQLSGSDREGSLGRQWANALALDFALSAESNSPTSRPSSADRAGRVQLGPVTASTDTPARFGMSMPSVRSRRFRHSRDRRKRGSAGSGQTSLCPSAVGTRPPGYLSDRDVVVTNDGTPSPGLLLRDRTRASSSCCITPRSVPTLRRAFSRRRSSPHGPSVRD
jgi:hypothetical protein